MVQRLRPHASNTAGVGLIPGPGVIKIPHTLQPKNQNIKQKQNCNKFNKDFKNGPLKKKKNGYKVFCPGITCKIHCQIK